MKHENIYYFNSDDDDCILYLTNILIIFNCDLIDFSTLLLPLDMQTIFSRLKLEKILSQFKLQSKL